MKFNPFRPNSIATDELFQGRKEEMQFIEKSLFLAKNGNPQHFLIKGELEMDSTVKYSLTTASDGKKYKINYYNLTAIDKILELYVH
jgi:hypothetical protein